MAKPRDPQDLPPPDNDWWQLQDSDARWQEHCQSLMAKEPIQENRNDDDSNSNQK